MKKETKGELLMITSKKFRITHHEEECTGNQEGTHDWIKINNRDKIFIPNTGCVFSFEPIQVLTTAAMNTAGRSFIEPLQEPRVGHSINCTTYQEHDWSKCPISLKPERKPSDHDCSELCEDKSHNVCDESCPEDRKCEHYYDYIYSCGSHKVMSDTPPQPQQDWEEQYDKLWIKNPAKQKEIKSFIKDKIEAERKRVLDEAREKIEKLIPEEVDLLFSGRKKVICSRQAIINHLKNQ